MKRVRIIPVLLIKDGGLVKSVKFSSFKYVGDPINAVKIFNEKEVDEIVILDISATQEKRGPDFNKIREIASEAFMPLAYGGGISTVEEISELIKIGVEKVVINTSASKSTELISKAAAKIGSQSIVVSIDVKKNIWGKYKVYVSNGKVNTGIDPVEYAVQQEKAGAGEIILNSIDKDGTFEGLDETLINKVASALTIPVVAVGGVGSIENMLNGIKQGASAIAAGSFFVFQRPHRAVLISYPSQNELIQQLFTKI